MKVSTASILVILALIVSLIGFSTASAAPSSGVAGTVTMSKPYIAVGGTLEVTLTDADLNVGVTQTDEASDIDNVTYSFPFTSGNDAGDTKVVQVKKVPILDRGSAGFPTTPDGIVNFSDVTVGHVDLQVISVDGVNGLVTVRAKAGEATNAAANFTLTYKSADVQAATVKITSTQDATGFTLRVRESGPNTGVFKATFKVGGIGLNPSVGDESGTDLNLDGDTTDTAVLASDCAANVSTCNNTRPTLVVVAGSVILGSYTDADPSGTRTGTSTVESTSPVSVLVEPAQGSVRTNPINVKLAADVTDADSGLDSVTPTLSFYVKVGSQWLQANQSLGSSPVAITPTITAITGGLRGELVIANVGAGETDIQWWTKVTDKAGNDGVSDTNTASTSVCSPSSFISDPAAQSTHKCDPYKTRVDTVAPGLVSAVTGTWWDAAKSVTSPVTDKSQITPTKANSVRVLFNDAINKLSVSPSDFKVTVGTTDIVPIAAESFGSVVISDGVNTINPVFLTLPSDLAANDTPKVTIVGSITDDAGNPLSSGNVTSTDGIKPTLSITTSANLSKTSIIITVTSNEALVTTPTITVSNQTATDGTTGGAVSHTDASLVATNTWQKTFSTATTPTGNNVKNVEASGTDVSGNAGTAGKANTKTAGAVTFQIDAAAPAAPNILPAGNVESRDPFISIAWAGEGTEYTGDSFKKVTMTKANLLALDSLGATTSTTDILANLITSDSVTYIYAAKGLALGSYKLVVAGTDEAANASGDITSATFTVKDPSPFTVVLVPDWNLVSIPRDPADPKINSVINSTHPITQVITYDPKDPALFLFASRTGTAPFSGTLTTISSTRAYWVFTSSFQSLSVTLAFQSPQTTVPSAVAVVAGWNLIPVMSIVSPAPTAPIDADDYLQSIRWTKAYGWDATNRTYVAISPGTADTVTPGRGYWVYVNTAGALIP